MQYPKWLYSAEGSVLVHSEAEHKALAGDWFESPALVERAAEEADQEEEKRKPGRPKKAE